MRMNTLLRSSVLAFALLALGSIGCATETKVLKTSQITLAYPEYWKVEKVGEKDGEPTRVTIGRYSTGVINEGSGAQDLYESSQADVDVRIYTWPDVPGAEEATKKATELMYTDPDLQLEKQGIISDTSRECGRAFKAKFTILKSDAYPLELMSRPGFRSILVGASSNGRLVGVAARVPFEQDGGLYCHNLSNMRTQLQTLLDGLSVSTGGATAAPPAPPGDAPKP
jgi:hypothetical protein